MKAASANTLSHRASATNASAAPSAEVLLLVSGAVSAALYPAADIYAASRYSGYSYVDQAVSELFAIGAPTSRLVVILFSLSSTLLLAFAIGIWATAGQRRVLRWMAVMVAANAVDALVLWNFFPMHMRGVEPTFTDEMHTILAVDPFVLATIVLGAVAFRGWFRVYSVATILFSLVLSLIGFSYVPTIIAQQPTPGLGLVERAAQYANQLWQIVLAFALLRGDLRRPAS